MKLFKYDDLYSRQPKKTGWKEDRYFRFFKVIVVFLAVLLMFVSLLRKPEKAERPGMVMVFAGDIKRDMQKFALKVPLYSAPKVDARIVKYYSDVNEKFIFVERAKGSWIKVVDSDQDTGWVSSYLLRFGPGR
jgi:hypothetical protein